MIPSEDLYAILNQYLLPILIFFTIAYIVDRSSGAIARRYQPLDNLTHGNKALGAERIKTLQSLLANVISIVAYIIAILLTIGRFASAESIIWVVGLFSAAFGLGARPFISDFLTGLSFIFEDTFDVGDKIEIPLSPQSVEGVVENVTLRITSIRGIDGELYTMPNGDIRLIRNFSRGDHSPTNVSVKVPADKVGKTITHLEDLGERAMTLLPNLIEPWHVITKSGELGEAVELTIIAKAKFGKGAEMRTRLLALLQEELVAGDILSTNTPPNDKIIP